MIDDELLQDQLVNATVDAFLDCPTHPVVDEKEIRFGGKSAADAFVGEKLIFVLRV